MKFSLITVAGLVALVSATPMPQADLSAFPKCAVDALMPVAKQEGCTLDNVKCLCTNQALRAAAIKKVPHACGLLKTTKALDAAEDVCGPLS